MTAPDLSIIKVAHLTKYFHLREGNNLQEHVLKWMLRKPIPSRKLRALHDVSFSVEPGDALGIIGKNGSGKSTLLKIMAGIMEPTEGQVCVSGRVCPMFGQGAGFFPDLTGRENVMLKASLLGLSDRQIKERFDEIVDFAELEDFIDSPIKRYSSGMSARLSFSVTMHTEPDILLIDETLAVGDAQFREKALTRMKELRERGVTILMVSHSMSVISELCNRAILLRDGCLVDGGEPKEIIKIHTESAKAVSAPARPNPRILPERKAVSGEKKARSEVLK